MKASSVRFTTCEKQFVGKSIESGIRLDGRQAYDYRNLEINFGLDYGYCEVTLGDTRALAQTSCELIKPLDSRPTDGQLFINVDLSPMASCSFESGRMTSEGVEINRLIDRVLKESRPIDTESLCVLAGEKVWSVRVDVLVLNHSGNILDCCCIAAIASLAHFRRPDVTVTGHDVTIHSLKEKEPVPLNVHHMPICITFGFIEDEKKGQQLIIDPEEKEESIIDGKLMMAFNIHNEVCCVQMSGGVSVDYEQLLNCGNIAALKAEEITVVLKEILEEERIKRLPKKIEKKAGLKTPATPREFITKTTAGPTEVEMITLSSDENDTARNPIAIVSDESEPPKEQVTNYLGKGTASLGEGGESAWVMSSGGEEEDNEGEDMEHDEKMVDNDESEDSEEDEFVVMQADVLAEKTQTTNNNMKIDTSPKHDEINADKKKKKRKRKKDQSIT
ncbi:exosome complex component RRP45-like isoform X2 [Clytia hemisphaerica]